MKTRVLLICGLSELITCTWAMRYLDSDTETEDILFVYGRQISMPAVHVETTCRLASQFGRWKSVINATEWSEQASRSLAAGEVVLPTNDVAAHLAKADEIYLHTIWQPFEKLILDLAPSASVILFDNGLDSHLSRKISVEPRSTMLTIRPQDLARVAQFVYTLGDYIPLPDFSRASCTIVPSASDLRKHYERLARELRVAEHTSISLERPAILSIGTSFYRLNQFDLSKEASVYQNFHDEASAKGYAILWKSHPRVTSALFASDQAITEPLPQSVPIELLPEVTEIAFSGSISSTALLTLKKVYGIPYQLLGPHLADKLSLPWLASLRQHAKLTLPTYQE